MTAQAPAATSRTAAPGAAEVDAFIDALWLEDGLSPNTLAAYRRDLLLYAAWLQAGHGLALPQTQEHHLQAYFAARAAGKATSANRRLTVFKRYFRWALREQLLQADPTPASSADISRNPGTKYSAMYVSRNGVTTWLMFRASAPK